jgi:predicted HicB family RNase H-like nuclease
VPVFLKAELENYLAAAAARRGVSLSDLINDMLEKDVAIAESVK